MSKFAFFDFNINFGGAPKGSLTIARKLQELGAEIIVYDAYGKNEKYINEIKISNLKYRVLAPESTELYIGGATPLQRFFRALKQLPQLLIMVIRLRTHLRKDKVDLLWVNNQKSLLLISISSFGLGVKKVLYHRGWARPKDFGSFYRLIVNLFCNAIVTHSRAASKNLACYFPNKHVITVPNGVEINDFTTANRKHKEGYTICLPAARPVQEKGHDTAVEALHLLHMRGYKDISLIFPGQVPVGHTQGFVKYLNDLIVKYKLEDNVDFIGWVDDVPSLLSNCNLVILPSHSEGFPRAIIEAMLVGTPVITTPVGGLPEAVKEGVTGYLIDVGDAVTLADKVEALYLDPSLGNDIAGQAKSFSKSYFSVDKQASIIYKVFNVVSCGRNQVRV